MEQKTKIIPTCCNACGGQTGILAHVCNGAVLRLEPNNENPIGVANVYDEFMEEKGRGARMCPKGLAAVKQLYDPDRLRAPLRRRPNGGWEKLTWMDALDLAAEKLNSTKERYNAKVYYGIPAGIVPNLSVQRPVLLRQLLKKSRRVWLQFWMINV